MDTVNDWHNQITNSTWQERNNFLLNNKFMSDCSFVVTTENGDAIKIPAHKYVLGGNSWDFYNLFFLMEAGSNEIPIADFSVDVVKIFLELIYRASAELTMDNIWEVLKLVERFSVKSVKAFCCEFLAEQITSENVMELLNKATDYDLEDFSAKCITHMESDGINYFETEEFLEIKNQAVVNICKSEELRGVEFDLYKSVYRWAIKSCEKNNQIVNSENIRLALGDAVQYIRFGAMTGSEFSKCVNENSILSPKETIQTFRFICDGEADCGFSTKNRYLFKKEFKVDFVGELLSGKISESGTSIHFSTNKPIFLLGVMTFGSSQTLWDNLCIVLSSSGKILSKNCFSETMDGSKKIYKQLLDKKVYLASNTKHTIQFYSLRNFQYFMSFPGSIKDLVFGRTNFKFETNTLTPLAGLIFE